MKMNSKILKVTMIYKLFYYETVTIGNIINHMLYYEYIIKTLPCRANTLPNKLYLYYFRNGLQVLFSA